MTTRLSPDPAGMPEFQDGLNMLRRAHQAGARDPGTLLGIGTGHLFAGELRKAVELAETAVTTDAISPETRYEAQEILAEAYDRLGNSAAAIRTLRELTREGRNPFFFYVLAQNEYQQGNADLAITAMQRAIQIDPAVPLFHEAIASFLLEHGDTKQSEWHAQTSRRTS